MRVIVFHILYSALRITFYLELRNAVFPVIASRSGAHFVIQGYYKLWNSINNRVRYQKNL